MYECTNFMKLSLKKALSISTTLTVNLLAPTTVGAHINPYPANVEEMVSS